MSGRKELSPEEQARRYEFAVWQEVAESYPGATPRDARLADKYQSDLVRAKRAKREKSEGWEKYDAFLRRSERLDKFYADVRRKRAERE
jgi:hypothetical protein